jgi:PRTRC genetic system ThiF family protein
MFTTTPPITLRLHAVPRVNLTLVGCGGTGSHLASGLGTLARTLIDRGTLCDLTFIDPDIVEEKNVGRQLFTANQIGQAKADILAERVGLAYGLAVASQQRAIEPADKFMHHEHNVRNIVVGAVDNPAARALIAKAVGHAHDGLWWLDCGNEHHSGQVALGNTFAPSGLRRSVSLGLTANLPAPHVVYPDLTTPRPAPRAARRAKQKAPSCAELAAAGEQGLMVNRMVAAWALAMLHDFLLGELHYFAAAFNMQWGGVRTWPMDLPTLAEVTALPLEELTVPARPPQRK